MKFAFAQTEHEDQVWGSRGSDWSLQMRNQYLASSDTQYEIVNDPDTADFILFWEPHQDSQVVYIPKLRAHPLVKRYPEKAFVVSVEDSPLGLLPGLYCSLPKHLYNPNRHVGWFYQYTPNPLLTTYQARTEVRPKYLASFIGADSYPVRRRLFDMSENLALANILVEESIRGKFSANPNDPALQAAQHRYLQTILDAKFALCPRGHGTSSFRIQESMALGRPPVIIGDQWVPPEGIDWNTCALFVPEADIARLPQILAEAEPRRQSMGAAARAAYDTHICPQQHAVTAMNRIASIFARRKEPEATYRAQWEHRIAWAMEQPDYVHAAKYLPIGV